MEPSPLSDPKLWLSALSLGVAGWAAFNSWRSRRLAERAIAISESQERRRQPQLGIYLADGYRRSLPDKKLFGFLVSVSNPTDINNSIAQAELQVTYLLEKDIAAVHRVLHTPALAETVADNAGRSANVFSLPLKIDAHQTISGWLAFAVGNEVIDGRTIDAHRILLEDSHGATTETEPILVREWTDETKKD